ncbi:MAG: IclR family transcriptional regulator [Tunicatimonas sp.]
MIQVLHRAVDIIEFIANTPERAAGLAEIADYLNLNRGTCANILKTLIDRDFVEQNQRKEYQLGSQLYRLTQGSFYRTDLIEAAISVMEELTAEVNESTMLAVVRKNQRLAVCEVESNHDLHVKNRVEKEIYETATGRVLLAYFSDKEKEAFIRKKGLPSESIWPEATQKRQLLKALDKIRTEKMTMQVSPQHIVGFAAPLYEQDQVVAGLGVFLPVSRLTESHQQYIISLLKRASEVISQNLTHNIRQPLLESNQ